MASMIVREKLERFPCPVWFSFITCITDKAMGNIIMVVAVLLSHILIRPVARMNPKTIRSPLVPVSRIIFNAMRRCRFHFSIASPNMNPPKKRNITGLAYEAAASSNRVILSKGKKISGNNATTGIGNASVTHQVIINPATAKTLQALLSTEKGLTNQRNNATAIPAKSEMNLTCCLVMAVN